MTVFFKLDTHGDILSNLFVSFICFGRLLHNSRRELFYMSGIGVSRGFCVGVMFSVLLSEFCRKDPLFADTY